VDELAMIERSVDWLRANVPGARRAPAGIEAEEVVHG
jgi:hypothetical protein